MQLTFHRANYTGYWVEHSPRSGSLRIFFDEEEVTHLHDVAEKAAKIVFTDYATPDTEEIAERIQDEVAERAARGNQTESASSADSYSGSWGAAMSWSTQSSTMGADRSLSSGSQTSFVRRMRRAAATHR